MMVHPAGKLRQAIQKSLWSQLHTTEILSEKAGTSLWWLRLISGKTAKMEIMIPLCPPIPISELMRTRYSTPVLKRNLGLVLSKSTLWFKRRQSSRLGRLDGLITATPAHRDHTTAQLVPQIVLEESFRTTIIDAVFTLASKFPVPMLKSCQASGNIRSVPLKVLPLVTSCGFQGTSCSVLQKISISRFLSLPNYSMTGTDLAATLIFRQKRCAKEFKEWSTSTKWWKSSASATQITLLCTATTTRSGWLVSMKPHPSSSSPMASVIA